MTHKYVKRKDHKIKYHEAVLMGIALCELIHRCKFDPQNGLHVIIVEMVINFCQTSSSGRYTIGDKLDNIYGELNAQDQ